MRRIQGVRINAAKNPTYAGPRKHVIDKMKNYPDARIKEAVLRKVAA